MVSSPDSANIPNLGHMSPNLCKLSNDDVDDSFRLGGTSSTGFLIAGIPNE
jgi:hypothetical protein